MFKDLLVDAIGVALGLGLLIGRDPRLCPGVGTRCIRSLDPDKTETTSASTSRIDERFPGSNLGRVCEELLAGADQRPRERAARPIYGLRIGGALIIVASIGALLYSVSTLDLSLHGLNVGRVDGRRPKPGTEQSRFGAAVFFSS